MLSLKNPPQHCTQMVKEHINANKNYSTYNTKMHFQKGKTIQLGKKLTCENSPKEARAQCVVCASNHNLQSTQCAK
jgi:hypothetical protein